MRAASRRPVSPLHCWRRTAAMRGWWRASGPRWMRLRHLETRSNRGRPPMFSHVTVGTNDVARAKAFYDGVGKALGLERLADYPEAAGYGRAGGRPQLWIVTPLDKKTATIGNGVTVGLDAANRP